MSVLIGVVGGFASIAFALLVGRILAGMIIPQSEIDKIDALGKWAKEELDRREERRENG